MGRITLVLLFTAIYISSAAAQNKDAILGRWVSSSGEAYIDITKKGSRYFGKIVKLKEPNDENGRPKTDYKNPNSSLRKRPILGLELLNDFIYEDGKWTDGTIYDPKSGKTYRCNMSLKENGQLSMRGYVGVSLIGRSEIWKRVK
jgi:uncharacterized protein (DUF2147 family)